MVTQEAAATEHTYAGGEIVTFKAYAVALAEGEEPLLHEGERLRITEVGSDGGMKCVLVNDKNGEIKDRQGDTVFPEEVTLLELPERTESAPAAKAAKATGGKKAATGKKAAAKSKTATKAKGKTAVKAKGKGKDKGKTAAKAKAPAKAKAQPTEEEVVVPEIKHDKTVLEILGSKEGAIAGAKRLLDDADRTYFTLGGVLHEIADKNLQVKAGFSKDKEGFDAFAENLLGVDYRKARYLIKIYGTFRDPRVVRKATAKALKAIGWSKAKELQRIGAEKLAEDWDALYELAISKPRTELIKHIKENYVVATRDNNKVKVTKFAFKLIGDGATTVKRALQVAAEQTGKGGEDLNAALEHIASEWLNLTEGVEQFPDVDSLIAYADEKFKATLTQVDSE